MNNCQIFILSIIADFYTFSSKVKLPTKAIEPGSMRTEDLDATTDNNENGSWGAQYNLKSQPE